MKSIAFITGTVVIRETLRHLREPKSPSRLMPARGPPLWEMPGSTSAAQVATGTHNGHAGAGFQRLVRRLRRQIND